MTRTATTSETIAKASDCTLVDAASDADRMEMLRKCADGGPDFRASLARRQLAAAVTAQDKEAG